MALIKQRLEIEAVTRPGETGQFDVIADGKRIATRGGNRFTRSFGQAIPISMTWSTNWRSTVRDLAPIDSTYTLLRIAVRVETGGAEG